MLPDKLAFVDLETTGSRSLYDRILEVGIIRVENNVITDSFHTLLNPLTHIPPEIERLTGITSKDIENAPVFSSVKKDILEILEGCVFVAHNVRFDYGFMKGEMKREGIDFTGKHFCTVKLSQYLYPQYRRHNLDSLIERHGINCTSRHRALDDAKVIAEFYQLIQKNFDPERVVEAVNKALKKPSVPLNLHKSDLDCLPEHPGVYTFFGENDIPLYIGKSINIKERVLSHFAADIRNSIEMRISQQINRIETETTAGELGALLLESKLIKEKLPLYNRRLRLKQQLVALTITTDQNGYDVLGTDTVSAVTPSDLFIFSTEDKKHDTSIHKTKILGFFRSVRQAKEYLSTVSREHELCEKLLGLEKTASGCFGYRLERCKGACIGKEKPLFYNIRLLQALSSIKIKPWPFEGPIMIEEKNELTEKYEYFFVDKWCFIGSTDGIRSWDSFESKRALLFDLDIYKILRRYLSIPGNMKSIKTLPVGISKNMSVPELGVVL